MVFPQRTLGIRLQEVRQRRKMSQEDAAEAVGVHPLTISKYERDHQDPNTKTLVALAKVYDVSTDWLLTEHERFIHHGFNSHEQAMRLAISLPNIVLRISEDALSDEAIKRITEFLEFMQQRERNRRTAKGAQES